MKNENMIHGIIALVIGLVIGGFIGSTREKDKYYHKIEKLESVFKSPENFVVIFGKQERDSDFRDWFRKEVPFKNIQAVYQEYKDEDFPILVWQEEIGNTGYINEYIKLNPPFKHSFGDTEWMLSKDGGLMQEFNTEPRYGDWALCDFFTLQESERILNSMKEDEVWSLIRTKVIELRETELNNFIKKYE